MIKVEVIQDLIDPNEELTKEKCLQHIKNINEIIKQSRASIYPIFLGGKHLFIAMCIILASFIFYMIYPNRMILLITFIEIVLYLLISIFLSEYINNQLKKTLLSQKKYFLDKLKQLELAE